MSFFGGLLSAFGIESEDNNKVKKSKKVTPKASFNLKKEKIERPDKIDGIKVIYIESPSDYEKALNEFKKPSPVLINFEYSQDKSRAMGYFEGYMAASEGKFSVIEENKLYILLPEGVEIE